jgi:hypothetical protein
LVVSPEHVVSRRMGECDYRVMVEIVIDLTRKLELGSVAVGVESGPS